MRKLIETFDFEMFEAFEEAVGQPHHVAKELIEVLEGDLGESPEAVRGAALALCMVGTLMRWAMERGQDSVPIGTMTDLTHAFVTGRSAQALRRMEEAQS